VYSNGLCQKGPYGHVLQRKWKDSINLNLG
jgi:hypothetical protein